MRCFVSIQFEEQSAQVTDRIAALEAENQTLNEQLSTANINLSLLESVSLVAWRRVGRPPIARSGECLWRSGRQVYNYWSSTRDEVCCSNSRTASACRGAS